MLLPQLFLERLQKIVPQEHFPEIIRSFETPEILSVRINTLKTNREEILRLLEQKKIEWQSVSWDSNVLILKNIAARELSDMDLVQQGHLYRQGLSSMLPALILNPQPGENILDLCAAPGSKTTQIAALMQNQGFITALEAIRDRYYRLRSVISLLGAKIIEPRIIDARRFKSRELFDRILADVPCSSEGRFKTFEEKSYAYWSPRKIKEMVQKQRGLLLNASRLLKPGGVLVYSTCTFAPEENEGVVDWLLRKSDNGLRLTPVQIPAVKFYPAVSTWKEREYHSDVKYCLRVLPDGVMEGFFMAKFMKM